LHILSPAVNSTAGWPHSTLLVLRITDSDGYARCRLPKVLVLFSHTLPPLKPENQSGQGKQFFFEKNQKTFMSLGLLQPERPQPTNQKFFCFFFSKKKTLLSLLVEKQEKTLGI